MFNGFELYSRWVPLLYVWTCVKTSKTQYSRATHNPHDAYPRALAILDAK